MPDIINPPPSSLTTNPSAQPSGRAAPADGNYHGVRVGLVKNPVAMLEDSAEELTFAHSEKVEKKLAKRKLGKRRIKTFATEQAERYLRQVPDLEKNKKLAAFAKEISQMGKSATPQQLQEFAKQSYPDVSHQFLALSYARDQLQNDGGDAELVSNLSRTVATLEEQRGAEIHAGINISASAHEAAKQGVGEVQGLRDFYRDVVLDYTSVTQAYEKIVEEHSNEKFMDVIAFLLSGLSCEAGKDSRSLPKTQLKAIMDDLYKLKLLGGMYHQCDNLMEKIHSNYQLASAHNGQTLLAELLQLKEKGWYSDQLIKDIAAKLDINQAQAKIYFFNGLKELIRLIPRKAFEDEHKRAELMDSVQQALDAAIDQETEE